MQLTTRGRYAVMAMVDLATHSDAGPVSLSEIAAREEISLSYLEQLFRGLRDAQLVQSVRGVNGGYQLARPVHAISIADIMKAADESLQTTRCNSAEIGCHKGNKCATHDLWDALGNHILKFLKGTTLQDVVISRTLKVMGQNPAGQPSQVICGK